VNKGSEEKKRKKCGKKKLAFLHQVFFCVRVSIAAGEKEVEYCYGWGNSRAQNQPREGWMRKKEAGGSFQGGGEKGNKKKG